LADSDFMFSKISSGLFGDSGNGVIFVFI
jgi:hypothetical protein